MQLLGKRIIVTGGAQGIGEALVRAYVAEGAAVASFDLKDVEGKAVADELSAAGQGSCSFFHCNVARRDDVDDSFRQAVAMLGGLDVLVHAAGIELKAPAEEITESDWDAIFDVNVKGTLFTNQAAFGYLREHGGRILDFASGAGVRGYAFHGHYAAAKGAVLSWVRTIAVEWGTYGITVNAICPGMWTPMYEATRQRLTAEELKAHDAALVASTPIDGKLGDPTRDLAPFMIFMASDGSRFITGQTLVVDGGRTIVR